RLLTPLPSAPLFPYTTLFRSPDGHGGLKRTQESTLLHAIEKAIGIDQVRLITTGGDAFEAEREQWNDANNVLTLRPGVVVGYERSEEHTPELQSRFELVCRLL